MRTARSISVITALLLPLVFTTRPLVAQSVYGQVWGRLTTVAGAPVSAAPVSVTSVQTGAKARTRTDSGGYFNISNLAPDLYQIDIQADGYQRVQGSVAVNADATASVNATLKPGNSNVIDSATSSALKLDRTDVSTFFNTSSIDQLPLYNNNLTNLQLLVPGASLGRLFIPPDQNPQNGQPVNINGQHFSGSAFQLDGTEDRDPLEGIVVINPTVDSVDEMKVTTQGYNAEFGQSTAGVVTVQTKTGTNSWHGDAFGFRRTGWGQSDNPFSPGGVPPGKYSIFGGSVGGPIVRNKLFIFGDYQGTRSSEGANLLLSVPSANVRNTCLGSIAPAGVTCDLSDYSKFINGSLMDHEGNPFPNYQIPNSGTGIDDHVTDQAAAVIGLLPAANYTPTDPVCTPDAGSEAVCNNYVTSGQDIFSADQFDVRTDYNASSRLRLFGRYSFGDFYDNGAPAFGTVVGGRGTNPEGFAGVARTRNQGISSGFTYTIGPKLLTDFRFGYFRYRLNVNSQNYGQIPPIPIPGIFSTDTGNPFATGTPDLEIPGQQTTSVGLASGSDYLRLGYSNIANDCNCPLRELEQEFQVANNWTRTAGQHIFKWGVDLRFLQNYRLESDAPPTGYFDFSPNITGLGLATFLIGDVTSFDRVVSTPAAVAAGEHQKRFGFYGQDTWRVNSRLTLNYGLRWEIYFPQTVTGAGGFLLPNLNNHDPAATYFNTPSATNPAGSVSGNLTNFGPRLGIAYLINSLSVIRAGYARSFDAGYAGDLFGIAATENPPVSGEQNIQSGGFNLSVGPPAFTFPSTTRFSLLDLANLNDGDSTATPPVPSSGAVVYALPSHVRVPTVDSWNVTLQHELTSRLYFEVGYVGNRGKDVFTDSNTGTYYNLNQPSLNGIIIPISSIPIGKKGPMYAQYCRAGAGGVFYNQYCLLVPEYRSFFENNNVGFNPTLFEVRYFGNNAGDNYNSLQTKVQKSFSHGYSFLAHYTWSKGLDYDSNYFAVDPRIGYGPTSFDIRHRFVMTNIWDLPIGRGRAWLGGIGSGADRFIGGWTITAVTLWRSGLAFSPTYLPAECAADTDSGDPCRPNLVGSASTLGSRQEYFTTTGGQPLQGNDCVPNGKVCGVDQNGNPVPGPPIGPWQRPGAGQIGTAGRDSIIGPSFFQADIGLAKIIPVSERVQFRFRADVFNVFNKVNPGNPNPCVDCTAGGTITALAPGALQRAFQFSARIEF